MPLCGDDPKGILNRISRIEGQVRGLRKMVDDDRDCFEVLKQIAAAGGAIRSLGMVLLEHHLQGCVSEAMQRKRGGRRLIREVIDTFNRFSK